MRELAEMERQLWLEGEALWLEHVTAEMVIILPIEDGICDRAETLRQVANRAPWTSVDMGPVYETRVADTVVHLSYEITAQRRTERYHALCGTVWRKDADGWRLVTHQQTPLP